MTAAPRSDALVFFGASGDLAYKEIFPALEAMIRTGALNVPVIGVAKSSWTIEQLRARARDSLEHHGGVDRGLEGPAAFARVGDAPGELAERGVVREGRGREIE